MNQLVQERAVTVMARFPQGGRSIRGKVVYGKNNKIVPGVAIVGGKEVKCPGCSYELRYYVDGVPAYKAVGKIASEAESQRRVLAAQLYAGQLAAAAGLKVEGSPERKSLKEVAKEYLEKMELRGVSKSHLRKNTVAISRFLKACSKKYADQVTDMDLLRVLKDLRSLVAYRTGRKTSQRTSAAYCRAKRNAKSRLLHSRTVYNSFTMICKWLKAAGVASDKFPPLPKYELKEVTIYAPSEIVAIFGVVTGDLRMALNLALKCGLRKREIMFLQFRDINFEEKTLLVRGKPEYAFHVKDYEERYIPIPDDLLEDLRAWRAKYPARTLVVQTESGLPDRHLLAKLKHQVRKAGLSCGTCEHCKNGNPDCQHFDLHKFRRTYITAILRYVDLRTAQELAGHSKIETTMRYLRPAAAKEVQKKVTMIDFTKSFYD